MAMLDNILDQLRQYAQSRTGGMPWDQTPADAAAQQPQAQPNLPASMTYPTSAPSPAPGEEYDYSLGFPTKVLKKRKTATELEDADLQAAREAHPVLRDRGHVALQSLEVREVILTQRDQDPVVAPRKVEAFDGGLVLIHLRFKRLRRAILDQVGQVLDELRRALPAELIALREREQLLELVEDQQRDERFAGFVAQDVVAVVQKLPQRFARFRDADLRPVAGRPRRTEDRLLDLLGRRWRFPRIVEPHIDRAIALGPQSRDDARAQDRRLAQARLAEQDREQFALHTTAELGNLLLATVEVGARLLGERREAEPGVFGISDYAKPKDWGPPLPVSMIAPDDLAELMSGSH